MVENGIKKDFQVVDTLEEQLVNEIVNCLLRIKEDVSPYHRRLLKPKKARQGR